MPSPSVFGASSFDFARHGLCVKNGGEGGAAGWGHGSFIFFPVWVGVYAGEGGGCCGVMY